MSSYVVETLNLSNGGRVPVGETTASVYVTVAGVRVAIMDRNGSVDVTLDTVNGESIRLGIEEVYATEGQCRLKVRGLTTL